MRVETRRIAGEDLEVWRWIQVSREGQGGGEGKGERVRRRGVVGGWGEAREAGNT